MKPSDLKVMVGSTVYGFENELQGICNTISTYDYQVLNSHLGKIKVDPGKSNLENCLEAVRECNLFLGIIRPFYGSGNINEKSIAFEEIKLAMELKKPYWFLVHHDVVFTRQLIRKCKAIGPNGNELNAAIKIERSSVFDQRVLDVYDFVIKENEKIALRLGNWAQQFYTLDDALTFVKEQFSDFSFIQSLLPADEIQEG